MAQGPSFNMALKWLLLLSSTPSSSSSTDPVAIALASLNGCLDSACPCEDKLQCHPNLCKSMEDEPDFGGGDWYGRILWCLAQQPGVNVALDLFLGGGDGMYETARLLEAGMLRAATKAARNETFERSDGLTRPRRVISFEQHRGFIEK